MCTVRQATVTWKEVNELINIKLRAQGLDPDKEMRTWCRFENNSLTLVYEQDVDAPLTLDGKVSQRPSYLERDKNR